MKKQRRRYKNKSYEFWKSRNSVITEYTVTQVGSDIEDWVFTKIDDQILKKAVEKTMKKYAKAIKILADR